MSIEISRPDESGPLRIAGRVDISSANELREALLQYLQLHAELCVDVSAVTACDASCLQLLLAARKSAQNSGKTLLINGLDSAVAATCADLGVAVDALTGELPRSSGELSTN